MTETYDKLLNEYLPKTLRVRVLEIDSPNASGDGESDE